MQVTAELSLYPLVDNYEGVIIAFIKNLKLSSEVVVLTHAMSTYVKGENVDVFKAVSQALEMSNRQVETLSLVIKVVSRDLPVENGFLNF